MYFAHEMDFYIVYRMYYWLVKIIKCDNVDVVSEKEVI